MLNHAESILLLFLYTLENLQLEPEHHLFEKENHLNHPPPFLGSVHGIYCCTQCHPPGNKTLIRPH